MGYIITADDYGMAPEIDRAIFELIHRKILSKVSIAVDQAAPYRAGGIPGDIQTGLHIVLPVCKNRNGNGHAKLLIVWKLFFMSFFHATAKTEKLIESISHQYNTIIEQGFKVQHLDAHLHLHIIPGMLKPMILFAKGKQIHSIRCITMEIKFFVFYCFSLIRCGFASQIPKIVLLYTAGLFMKRVLDKHHIGYTRNLVLMPLASQGNYGELLQAVVSKAGERDVEIVTHPGFIQKCGFDDYIEGRQKEYEALNALGSCRSSGQAR
ncbi:MAG: ChbG/HpnK family deacetylase [Desulfobacteraceae bacterium]|nr:MAG: ChbG/HpnK family deacetylase [Desulfobacteraceae bacterium]